GIEQNHCSAPLSFLFLDYENLPVAVTGTVAVHIVATGNMAYYTDATCSAALGVPGAIATFNVTNAYGGAFSILPPNQGAYSFTVSIDDPLVLSDTLSVSVGASNDVTQLLLQADPGFAPVAGQCSQIPVWVRAANAAGQVVTTPTPISFSVTFSTGSGTIS